MKIKVIYLKYNIYLKVFPKFKIKYKFKLNMCKIK